MSASKESVEQLIEEAYLLLSKHQHQPALDKALMAFELESADSTSSVNLEILYLIGELQIELQQTDQAIKTVRLAFDINPSDQRTKLLQAGLMAMLGQLETAVQIASSAQVGPRASKAYYLIGLIALDLSTLEEAEKYFRKALEYDPKSRQALLDLGLVYAYRKQYPEAQALIDQALLLGDLSLKEILKLGNTFLAIEDYGKAFECYYKAVEHAPSSASAHSNLGLVYHIQGQLEAAINSYILAVFHEPMHSMAHLNLGIALLLMGDFATGWAEYEWRRALRDDPHICDEWSIPEITSANGLPDVVIIAHENGIGDSIQFMRYGQLVRDHGRQAVLLCPPKMAPVADNSGLFDQIETRAITTLEDGKTYGWIPALSIPKVFGITPEKPLVDPPYLFPPTDRVKHWHDRLRTKDSFLVGLHWQGNPAAERTTFRGRSLPLAVFESLASLHNIHFVSLQKGYGSEQMDTISFRNCFVDAQSEVDEAWDFIETMAIAKCCDVVVSSDSGLAHLVGAMGHPLLLLLSMVPEWRWGLVGDRTAWYPSARLYRQTMLGDWTGVIERVRLDLEKRFNP
ncbi:tetratricopeptide repeat protein [Cyanobium sp. ATX 6F1]|uniref:tetratricopeptide repeat protein n=1 Tax=unclassified Cyanobium TaxID=2627006 RepID=UPI0020CFBEA4|nr:tetratricopeptide repeat protein [Cyanobium sp. ATX 6F1]MCP9915171.1 tetratricopeptide repeat protein [Cyanobium sp. ATX 6F1]